MKNAASTKQGQDILGILAIADGPEPTDPRQKRRYWAACDVATEYRRVASIPWYYIFPCWRGLWKVFKMTEEFKANHSAP